MKKKLGFYSIVLYTINSIIGTGIFLSPGSVVKMSGDKALIVYLLAAVFAAVLALTFASASKYVSEGGASYAYSKAAFGKNVGFYVGITRFVATSLAWGVMATAVVKTVMNIFGMDPSNLTNVSIGFIVLMLILLIINALGTSVFEFFSNLSTIGKVGALLTTILVGAGLVVFGGVNNFDTIKTVTNDAGEVLGSNMNLSAYVMAVVAALYAFTGFESVASASHDMEQPEKNLPKALPIAIAIIAFIYIGIVGIAMMVNPVELVQTKEVAALAAVFTNPIVKNIVIYGALLSMFGINVAASFGSPRVLEAMAIQGQLPSWLAKRTEKGFPIYSTLVTMSIAIIMPLAFKFDMTSITVLSAISRFVQFVVVPLAVIAFYYGKNKEKVHNANKSLFLDVVIPVLALGLTVLLLSKFNWAGQFTTKTDAGVVPNTFAIVAMVLGYVVIPAVLMVWNKIKK